MWYQVKGAWADTPRDVKTYGSEMSRQGIALFMAQVTAGRNRGWMGLDFWIEEGERRAIGERMPV